MAALPSAEAQSRAVSDAAQTFVDHYYDSRQRRHGLGGYYSTASAALRAAGAGAAPDISVNGRALAGGVGEYEALLAAQGGPVTYAVGGFDAQPVTPVYALGCPPYLALEQNQNPRLAKGARDGDRVSFALQVNGTLRFGGGGGGGDEEQPAEERAFNESFLLVPHWEALAPKAPRGLRRWLIVSQNYRVL
ncbi:nuclear transport factor 2 domain-containing protein [Xylariomycetidae sp. FL0641]|nr:nuclear transport factor 2 domain-containing protein [Xylariomycetidae sp. FL0641]